MNPWHHTPWVTDGDSFLGVVTIPLGATVQYRLDAEGGWLRAGPVFPAGLSYPVNGAFLPQTLTADNLPLELMVLGSQPLLPLSRVRLRPVGLIQVVVGGQVDSRLVSVHCEDRSVGEYECLTRYPHHRVAQLKQFLEEEWKVCGRDAESREILGREASVGLIAECRERYSSRFGKS